MLRKLGISAGLQNYSEVQKKGFQCVYSEFKKTEVFVGFTGSENRRFQWSDSVVQKTRNFSWFTKLPSSSENRISVGLQKSTV